MSIKKKIAVIWFVNNKIFIFFMKNYGTAFKQIEKFSIILHLTDSTVPKIKF